jgi:hypothetical protein
MPMNNRLLRPRATGFNPKSIAGLTAWYDAADAATITAVSGGVSVWADKSGLGRTLYQGTAANRPATGTRTIGGKNALDFDGSNDCLLSGDPGVVTTNGASYSVDAQSARALAIFVVCAADTPDAVMRLVSLQRNRTSLTTGNANDTGAYLARHTASTANWEMATGAGDATSNDQLSKNFLRRTTASFSTTNAEVVSGAVSASANTLTIRNNGTDQALTTRYGTNTASGFLSEGTGNHSLDIGCSRGGSNVANPDNWNGVVGEVLVYLATLTASQTSSIERYLGRKWGVTIA